MLRVFGVVCVFEKYWIGESLNWKLIKKLALVHDLGNIVKFYLSEDQADLKELQGQIIEKYGSDDHVVTQKMLEELGFKKEEVEIVLLKSFGNSIDIANSDNCLLKILYYADMRVLPSGVGTIEDRISDIKNRMPKYSSRPDFGDLVSACHKVENQLQERTNFQLPDISEEMVKSKFSEVRDLEV